MNLKLVVASMSLLGLVSCPVFADTTTTKEKHHPIHHKVKHHVVKDRDEGEHVVRDRDDRDRDYREREVEHVAAQPCPVEVCSITQETMIMEGMTQNMGRAIPNPCTPDWYKRVLLGGGLNVDIGKWGNRNGNYMGENYQRLSLNDAYLNLAAEVNDWVHAFVSISYNTATINDPLESSFTSHVSEYDAAYDENVISGSAHTLQLEQAFATLANFSQSPLFLTVGKQFQDFSRYEIHPITESLTQVMSKTLATSVKLGFITEGFNGAIYVFDDPLPKVGQSKRSTNYGIALGYDQPSDCVGFDIGVAYLYNLIGVNDIAYQVNQFNINNLTTFDEEGYNTRVGGVALYADVNSGPFTLGARYTTAVQRFNVNDLPKHGVADLLATGAPIAGAQGAKPWSAGIEAAYGFDGCGYAQKVYVGYQASRDAGGLMIPKSRWLAGYGMDVMKWTTLALEWDHDQAYSTSNGGSGNNANLVTLRAGVKFG